MYEGLVGAHDALMTGARLRYQEALKRLESVEAGCKKRLKPEYWGKFEGCLAFLRAESGKMYVELIEKGADHVRQWLETLKSLYIDERGLFIRNKSYKRSWTMFHVVFHGPRQST